MICQFDGVDVICVDVSDGAEVCSVPSDLVLLHDALLVVREAASLLRHHTVFLGGEQVSCQEEKVADRLAEERSFCLLCNSI